MRGAQDNESPIEAGLDYQRELIDLFDVLVNVMFCVKDRDGRYLEVNTAFVRRSGRSSKRDVLGATAADLFPPVLAERYAEQDRIVFERGVALRDEIELIRRPTDSLGWYLTTKIPIHDGSEMVALASVSRDLESPSDEGIAMESLTQVVDHVREHLGEPLRVADLAQAAGCTDRQLERRMKQVFGITATQYILRVRVDRAVLALTQSDDPIASIAADCGFYDQAAFTRQFARLTGDTPNSYRRRHPPGSPGGR